MGAGGGGVMGAGGGGKAREGGGGLVDGGVVDAQINGITPDWKSCSRVHRPVTTGRNKASGYA